MNAKTIAAAAILLTSGVAATAASSRPLQVKVDYVNDRRTNGSFSQLTISLELPEVLSPDVAAWRVLVKGAEDDTGRSLVDSSATEPSLESNRQGAMSDDKKSPTRIRVELKNPDRKAARIKEVRGDIELFMPGRDANSIATIPRFTSFSGKSLANKALKANGVEISLVSSAQLDAERKAVGDKRREEAKKEGAEGEDLESAVTNAMDNFFKPDPEDVVLKVSDPNHRIQDISFVDKTGEAKPGSKHDVEGYTIVSRYGEKPAADWSLRVSLQTLKNIVRYPFVLNDVPLP